MPTLLDARDCGQCTLTAHRQLDVDSETENMSETFSSFPPYHIETQISYALPSTIVSTVT
jgi:hypothetical protein